MKYEKEFREAHPETIGEADRNFDLRNYCDWVDKQTEALRKENEELSERLNNLNNIYKQEL